jgi:hypothetical protein
LFLSVIGNNKESMLLVGATNQGDEVLINEFWQGRITKIKGIIDFEPTVKARNSSFC